MPVSTAPAVFALAPCRWGQALIALSPAGVVALHLGDDPDALVRAFRAAHPAARPGCLDAATLEQVLAALEDPSRPCAVPLAPAGTPFQHQVWQALRTIAPGATVGYAHLARQLGMPTAARAVARACATNPVAVLVPCHRVVPAGGGLGGYRWGVARKRALLEAEGALSAPGNRGKCRRDAGMVE